MSCEKCKKPKETSLNQLPNWTEEELKQAYDIRNLSSYTPEQKAWFYNLYNRVFKENKIPGACGKCFLNVRTRLTYKYEKEYKIL